MSRDHAGMLEWFASNSWFTGGAMVLVGGAVAGRAMEVPNKLFKWARNRLFVTVDIDSTDPAFFWVKQLVAERSRSRWLMANSLINPNAKPDGSASRSMPKFIISPRGLCWFRQRGRRVLAWVDREIVQGTYNYRETISLQVPFAKKDFFQQFLVDAWEFANKNSDLVEIWVGNAGDWMMADRRPVRDLKTLCLSEDRGQKLIDDAKQFLKSEQWYRGNGIPYRRGYLFDGPPGNGKTSMVHVMASALRRNVSVLNIPSHCDSALAHSMLRIPSDHIILLEDIDCVQPKREQRDKGAVSLAGLLNAIDGIAAQEGRIIVMTTNHKDKIDPALIRPGRADVHATFDNATGAQALAMFMRFHPDCADGELIHGFALQATGKSLANIQKALILSRESPADASNFLEF